MRRRALLTSIATASLAGCLGAAEVSEPQPCHPGEDTLGSLLDAVTTEHPPNTVRIRAEVARVGYRLVLTDGTGWGVLDPSDEYEAGDIERGDCVAATCYLNEDRTKQTGVPRLSVHRGEAATVVDEGPAGEPPTVPTPPQTTFDVRSDGREAVVVHHVGPASIPARRLQLRNVRTDEGLLDTARWHELTGKGPDDPVTEGDTVRFEWPGTGVVCWRDESGWVESVSESWTIE